MSDFVTVEELAERLKVSSRTVQRLINNRELRAVKVGRQWRFREEWIDEWLSDNTTERDESASDESHDTDGMSA